MAAIIAISKHPMYRKNILRTAHTMRKGRCTQYAAWFRDKGDAEMYTQLSLTAILLPTEKQHGC